MPHLIVRSEGDMEYSLKYTTALALDSMVDEKDLEISFPSVQFMQLFMHNLFRSFIMNKVPSNNNLNLQINIPDDEYDTNRE